MYIISSIILVDNSPKMTSSHPGMYTKLHTYNHIWLYIYITMSLRSHSHIKASVCLMRTDHFVYIII